MRLSQSSRKCRDISHRQTPNTVGNHYHLKRQHRKCQTGAHIRQSLYRQLFLARRCTKDFGDQIEHRLNRTPPTLQVIRILCLTQEAMVGNCIAPFAPL